MSALRNNAGIIHPTSKERWLSDSGDRNYVKLLMVVLEVKGRIAKTKYINAEEIRELERWKPRKKNIALR